MSGDENVIKRRLLIDGDGTGDDRRINVLLKNFIKWSNTNDTPEDTQAAYDRMLTQLAQCEFTVKKSEFSTKMMENELMNYQAISKTIDSGIEHAKVQIDQSKQNLVLAKKIRKNRMEYDVLAKVISQQPDRKETKKKLEALNKELDELKERRKQLQRHLEMRRNEFTVLMRSIQELQTKLDSASSICFDQELDNDLELGQERGGEDNAVRDEDKMSIDGDGELPDSPPTVNIND